MPARIVLPFNNTAPVSRLPKDVVRHERPLFVEITTPHEAAAILLPSENKELTEPGFVSIGV